MKKLPFLFVICALIQVLVKAQSSYNMTNGLNVVTCNAYFYDSGGPNSNYSNNENSTATFKSLSGEKLKFTFQQLDLTLTGGDTLFFYDGESIYSPIIAIITGNSIPAPIVSSYDAITVRFVSNLINTGSGWKILINCIYPPSGCGYAPIPSDHISQAPGLCSGATFCGTTNNFYTPDFPFNLCQNCNIFNGTIENNAWYYFRATNNPICITINTTSCSNNQGIQYAIYSIDSSGTFVLHSNPNYTINGAVGTIHDTIYNLIPENIYYLMIDGHNNDVCEYSLVITGVKHPTLTITEELYSCSENSVLLYANGGYSYYWTSSPVSGELASQANNYMLVVHPTTTTIYSVHITDTNLCNVDTTLTTVVNILSNTDTMCFKNQFECKINATSNNISISQGESTLIYVSGRQIVNIFNESFDKGYTPTTVNIEGTVSYGFKVGLGFNGSDYPWFTAGNVRKIETQPVDVSGGGFISFYIRYGKVNTIENGPNAPNKGVALEYSIDNGTTWNLIKYFNPVTGTAQNIVDNSTSPILQIGQLTPLMSWKRFVYEIPQLAQTQNTIFRWRQNYISNYYKDLWGLDSISIVVIPNTNVTWSSIPNDPGLNPNLDVQNVSPSQTTNYIANVSSPYFSCSDTITIFVEQNGDCNASFNALVSGNTVLLNNNSTGTYQKVFWNFGDGGFSNNINISAHHYNSDGFYKITLTIIDTISGCQDETSKFVAIGNVSGLCQAKIYYQDLGNNTIAFVDSSLGTYTSRLWIFGDGSTSIEANPVHQYSNSGYYNVKLLVVNNNSNFTSTDKQLIKVGDNVQDCEASFIYFSNMQFNKVIFKNKSLGENLNKYLWNFGDGDTSTLKNPIHVFDNPGFYNVCLTVASTVTGCQNTRCKMIKVGSDSLSCVANFSYFTDSSQLMVKLINNSLPLNSIIPLNNKWTFGDNSPASFHVNPTHFYSQPGIYPIHLRVINPINQCVSNHLELVNVGLTYDTLVTSFIYVIDSLGSKANQFPVKFKGTAFGDPARYSWDFGDGSDRDTTTLEPIHIYDSEGLYHVCFTAYDENTAQHSTYCEDILVNDQTVGFSNIVSENIFMCYPNPFNEHVNIYYQLKKETKVKITINDIYGKVVYYEEYNNQKPGIYKITWIPARISEGLYFVNIENSEFINTLKLLYFKY